MQALFEGAVLRLTVCQSRLDGAGCRSSHVRNAPLATVGPKKAACRDGPKGDITAIHSTTSSARASSDGDTVRPRALAVLRLIANSYLVGACTGRSAAFSPLRMRST